MVEPIITSLLDTDLYKFTMMQCAYHQFPGTQVEYRFKNRQPIDLRPYRDEIMAEIEHLCTLRLTQDELDYLSGFTFMKPDFIDYLTNFHLNIKHVHIPDSGEFTCHFKGPWEQTILFEVPALAIISEVINRNLYPSEDYSIARQRLQEKIELVKTQCPELHFSDFGTRRRFSKRFHHEIIEVLKAELSPQLLGTSNLYLAKNLQLRPIGTMAHEYLQACQVLAPSLKGSQHFALNMWLKEYPNNLKIALTDTLTMDVFLQEFDKPLALAYDGLRQDSGDPFDWTEKALQYYRSLGIDPRQKTFVYSNGLTIQKAIDIHNAYHEQATVQFGIGTHLTNDVGHPALDIVIKLTHTNGQAVAKISDSKGKNVCEDPATLQTIKTTFSLKD